MHTGQADAQFFVCRDRARRYSKRIREALQERRLSWRGDEIGMETLTDRADPALAETLADIERTRAEVEAGTIRDRERGYMEVPLLLCCEGIADRIRAARRLTRAQDAKAAEKKPARAAVLALLEDALRRLDAYCVAYDAKKPIGPAQLTDVARLLTRVAQHQAWHQGDVGEAARPFDRPPSALQTDPEVLEDLLRAAWQAAPTLPGPWTITPATPTDPLRLVLGTPDENAQEIETPDRLAEALQVLGHLHPVTVSCIGHEGRAGGDGLLGGGEDIPARIQRVELSLTDRAAGSLEAVVGACAGVGAVLQPDAETAVRRLLEAPPMPESGTPPPTRAVALMGLLKALDDALVEILLPRTRRNSARVAASQVPREKTRKAPVRKDLLLVLGQDFVDFPTHRVDDVLKGLADGRLGRKHARGGDMAVVLALIGRTWRFAGRDLRRALDLGDFTDTDVEATIQDACDVAIVRKDLEAGKPVDAVRWTRLERAAIGLLGRLGRLDAGGGP